MFMYVRVYQMRHCNERNQPNIRFLFSMISQEIIHIEEDYKLCRFSNLTKVTSQ